MAISTGAALIGGAVIGGAASMSAASKASSAAKASAKAQKEATDASAKVALQQLEFSKQQYADWQAIFGPIQQNLADYYGSLDADKITALGLQNAQREFQASQAALEKTMAQRGIAGSGIEAAGQTALAAVQAQDKALIRTQAVDLAAQRKEKFLGLGLGLESSLSGNIQQSSGALSGVYQAAAGMAATNQQSALQQQAAAYNAFGNVIGSSVQAYALTNLLQK